MVRLRGRNGLVGVACAIALVVAVVLAAARSGEIGGQLSVWQALALGLTQGLTEFLPIPSSGHLILVPWLADWRYLADHDPLNKTFDVALHVGTLIALVGYFARDIGQLIVAFARTLGKRRAETAEEKIAWYIAIATVPAVIVGAVAESAIDRQLGNPWQIAIFVGVFAVGLYFADRMPVTREIDGIGRRGALYLVCCSASSAATTTRRSSTTASSSPSRSSC